MALLQMTHHRLFLLKSLAFGVSSKVGSVTSCLACHVLAALGATRLFVGCRLSPQVPIAAPCTIPRTLHHPLEADALSALKLITFTNGLSVEPIDSDHEICLF
jgi:hypothetical protein